MVSLCGKRGLYWGRRTFVMGIINVSPDSFSGDGLNLAESALKQAQRFIVEGADILDIGGESTRPNHKPISEDEELQRVIPVIEIITSAVDIPVSIDSTKYEVARQALKAGACFLNDQWGLKRAPQMAELAVEFKAPIVLMSNQRDIGSYDISTGRDTAFYPDVMQVVISYLKQSIAIAQKAGINQEDIIIDPGIGFGKTWEQDIEIIRRLKELKILGCPILIGTSRKSLIKMVLHLPANDRLEGTAATVAISIANGADIVRVHDVKQMVRVCKMTDAITRGV